MGLPSSSSHQQLPVGPWTEMAWAWTVVCLSASRCRNMAEWRILFRLCEARCTKVRCFVAAVPVFIFGRTAACLYYGDPGRSMLDASLVCTCLLARTVSNMCRTM